MSDAKRHVNIHISPQFANLRLSLTEFEQNFDDCKNVIQKSRNTIKAMNLDGLETVVKSFKRPNALQGFIYTYLRKSKARRSFEYAQLLLDRGICTPIPVAYIEVYNGMRLQQSYYISQHYDYDFMIRDVVENKVDDRDDILKQFAAFTHSMHRQGILHLDYSTGNTLIQQLDDGVCEFCVVDINRLKIGTVSGKTGICNFSRISNDPQTMKLFAAEYARLANLEPDQCYDWLSQAIQQYRTFRQRKQRAKRWLKLQKK